MLMVLRMVTLLLLFNLPLAHAAQYVSRELSVPQTASAHSEKSINELEKEVAELKDAYARASTERFLARFYLQQGQEGDLQKAIKYYQQALTDTEEGLSRFAKQETVTELATIYFFQKNYTEYLHALEQLIDFGGQLDLQLQIKQAVAFYHLGKKQAALKNTHQVYQSLKKQAQTPDKSTLQQLLFLFFHLQSYQRAADVQQQLLSLEHDDINQWRRLAQIYIKAGKNDRAAESLLLAYKKGLVLSGEDLMLLCDLLALAKNPFAAATYLQEFMQKGLLSSSVIRFEKLFNYWFKAGEIDKAIAALNQAAELKPDVERFLNLAELHRQQGQWKFMQNAVLKACSKDLADEFVSRANVLLGISELKQGNKASARQAFINATLVGGRGDVANQYLHYMQAPEPTEKELSSFYGPCKPVWANNSDRSLSLAGVTGFAVQKSDVVSNENTLENALYFSIKTQAPQRFLLAEYTIDVQDLENKLRPLAMKLGAYTLKNGGKINGPLHFIFPEAVAEGATKISFQMAFPISKAPRIKGRYKVLDEPEYYCASFIFNGPKEALLNTWQAFYAAVIAKGYSPTGSGRQIVLSANTDSADGMSLELQIQLKAMPH